ncbi:hypothetical protein GCM10027082_34710 [Comamonas humi]
MLEYLDFERSDDGEGTTTWDALADVDAARWPQLERELVQVLGWAAKQAGKPGPLDDGHAWHYDLQLQDADGRPLAIQFSARTGSIEHASLAHTARLQLALSLSGSDAFAEAFDAQWGSSWD